MIAAIDVHYLKNGRASAAAVLFRRYGDAMSSAEYTKAIAPASTDYIPGQFYKRELPSILTLLEEIKQIPDEFIVDGYVTLGKKPGLGQYLFTSYEGKIPVIGVAKSKFEGASGIEVLRGKSKRPLYVTSAGISSESASEKIRMMHGNHRIPTLLKRVDFLARENARLEK